MPTQAEEAWLPTDTTAEAILKAALFAARKHSVQRRKDEAESPYVNHPLAVAEVLARHGVSDVVALQAALIHDTVEDTETSIAELRETFGSAVADVVVEVTDDKTLGKMERKRLQIEHAASLSDHAKLVKLGDKICNVFDVAWNAPPDWPLARRQEYLDWTQAVVEGCRGVHPALEAHYDQVLQEARDALREDVDGQS